MGQLIIIRLLNLHQLNLSILMSTSSAVSNIFVMTYLYTITFSTELLAFPLYNITIQLFNTAECSMNGLQLRRFCRVLCDNTRSKKLCGRILNVFASRMLSSEATSFICETVSFDFFLDLSGSMRGFYKEIPEIRDSVEAFLKVNRHMDKEGELVDSDVDEDGNLW